MGVLSGLIFVILSILAYVKDVIPGAFTFILGLIACFSVILLVANNTENSTIFGKVMGFLSKYTMPIFLMNMWGLTPEFLDVLEKGFKEFFEKEVPGNPLKAEYLIPIFIGELLEQGKMAVKVLKTNDTWYGMTYHEDVAAVKDSFKKMLENGVYKADLFSDL